MKVPTNFGPFLGALNKAGVETRSPRGFWGGITADGDIVATAWIDDRREGCRFWIGRPPTNHGGMKEAWDIGRIAPGTTVQLILVRQRGNVPLGVKGRKVKDAALLPGCWRVVEMHDRGAVVEPVVGRDCSDGG